MSQIKYFWEALDPGSVRELGSIRHPATPDEIARLEEAGQPKE
jgi:hypothetical protein